MFSAKALDCYHCGDWPYSANCLEHDAVLMTCPEVPYSSKTACFSTSMSVGNMKCTVIYDDTLDLNLYWSREYQIWVSELQV